MFKGHFVCREDDNGKKSIFKDGIKEEDGEVFTLQRN